MDYNKLKEETDNYILDLKNSEEYKKLLNIYKRILSEHKDLVLAFNLSKKKLEEALEYGNYYPGLQELKLKYQEAKANLYSLDLVKEYFLVSKDVEILANEALEEIKKEIN